MPMNSREKILARMRSAQQPFPSAQSPVERLAVTPIAIDDKEALAARFIKEAQVLSCQVHAVENDIIAAQAILEILAEEKRVLAWDFGQIPCQALETTLHEAGVAVAAPDDPTALSGVTGADAALAATGSLVMVSGPGRQRTVSILPRKHIAIITQDQILANMENWLGEQRKNNLEAFNKAANINIISGPSRTADISMELILGMHGPKTLHIIIISN